MAHRALASNRLSRAVTADDDVVHCSRERARERLRVFESSQVPAISALATPAIAGAT